MGAMVTRTAPAEAPTAVAPAGAQSRERGEVERLPTSGRWPAPGTIHGAWTVVDLESLPDDGLRYEILDGLLIVSPAPVPLHQIAVGEIYTLLRAACPTSARVLIAPRDWQPEETTSVQSDVLVVRRSDVLPRRLAGTPLLVVEVLSPATRRVDRVLKFERYQRAGVGQYWIVDPGSASVDQGDAGAVRPPSVEVYELADGEYRLQVRIVGEETATVSGPLTLTVSPAALIA